MWHRGDLLEDLPCTRREAGARLEGLQPGLDLLEAELAVPVLAAAEEVSAALRDRRWNAVR